MAIVGFNQGHRCLLSQERPRVFCYEGSFFNNPISSFIDEGSFLKRGFYYEGSFLKPLEHSPSRPVPVPPKGLSSTPLHAWLHFFLRGFETPQTEKPVHPAPQVWRGGLRSADFGNSWQVVVAHLGGMGELARLLPTGTHSLEIKVALGLGSRV